MRAARDAGLLLYSGTGLADGTNGDAILLGPPFVITDAELERLVDVLGCGDRFRDAGGCWMMRGPGRVAGGVSRRR